VIGKFWESVGGKLAERWAAAAGPALVFWTGGLLAWTYGHGGWSSLGTAGTWLQGRTAAVQVVVLVGLLIGVLASGMAVRSAAASALRVLEGYLPRWLAPLRRVLVRRMARAADRRNARLQALAPAVLEGTATAEEQARFQQLDRARRRVPSRPERLMPTRVGNTLRAAESRPVDKYGLDPVAVWPHLWLLLPEHVRTELLTARAAVDGAVMGLLWALLSTGFTVWTWWALPAGLGVAALALLVWLPARAATFGDLFEAAFDLHRLDLYRQLRRPVPAGPEEEAAAGRQLTRYLVRGASAGEPAFVPAEAS